METTTFHPIINYILTEGVPFNTLYFLLIFPVITTLVVILRQFIGLQAFGIYTPAIITAVFLAMGSNNVWDIRYPIAVYVAVLVIGMLMRYALRHFRLLYLPRVGLTVTIVSFSVLAILTVAASFDRLGFATASFFPLLILITLVEKFVAIQIEKGTRTGIIIALETLIIAIIGFLLLSPGTFIGQYIISLLVIHPYIVLLIIPINIALGKWTGLRVAEYLRFRDVLNKIKD